MSTKEELHKGVVAEFRQDLRDFSNKTPNEKTGAALALLGLIDRNLFLEPEDKSSFMADVAAELGKGNPMAHAACDMALRYAEAQSQAGQYETAAYMALRIRSVANEIGYERVADTADELMWKNADRLPKGKEPVRYEILVLARANAVGTQQMARVDARHRPQGTPAVSAQGQDKKAQPTG